MDQDQRGTPDRDRDVIVQHVRAEAGSGDRWVIFVGAAKRAEMDNSTRALVFARLLADLQQRPVWIGHQAGGALEPLDPSSIRGCPCC